MCWLTFVLRSGIVAKKENRIYSRYTMEALKFFSQSIRMARIGRRVTAQELAQRAGISRDLLRRIENGDPACGIGVVFEVAALLDLPLFQSDYEDLVLKNKVISDKVALLPARIYHKKPEIDNDF